MIDAKESSIDARVCCVCNRLERRGQYTDIGEPILKYLLENYRVSHSYCPDCSVIEFAKLEEYKRRKYEQQRMRQ